jgi:hypothetical protein
MINTDSGRVFRISANKYFLVDFSDTTTTTLKLTILPYLYNRLSFVIGVDSARNVSGAQTGALDPANGMFWTWNTGYIMAKWKEMPLEEAHLNIISVDSRNPIMC